MKDKDLLLRAFGKLGMQVVDGVDRQETVASVHVSQKAKHGIVLLCGSDISLTSAFEQLRDMSQTGWRFTAVLSASAERLLSEDALKSGFSPVQVLRETEGVSIKRLIEMMDALIIPNMTQNTLAKLAVGIQDELTALITWQALVEGKSVVVCTDSVFKGWFDIDKNRAMKRVMQSHVAALKGFGAKLADKHEYAQLLESKANRAQIGTKSNTKADRPKPVKMEVKSFKQTLSAAELSEKKLLTEKDIKALCDVTEIEIGKGQILTPLGRDAAISKGIRIIYQRQ